MTEIEVRAPYDGQLIRTVRAAVRRRSRPHSPRPTGCSGTAMPGCRRPRGSTILRKTARLMEEQAEDLARGAAHEGGKPLVDSRVGGGARH